jgi:hypothetical protein
MRTAGQLLQDTPNTDGQIFIGPDELISPALTNSALSQSGEGLLVLTAPAAATTDLYKTIDKILRTGQAPNYQEQFGTAALVPGPSAVANTSDPLGLVGMPPIKQASLATLKGPITGFVPKGIEITSVDLIYQVATLAVTSVSFGLTATKYGLPGAGATAPVVTNVVTFGTNSLPVAISANPVTTRIAIANPIFIVSPETKLQLHVRVVAPATAVLTLAGVILNVAYNYN